MKIALAFLTRNEITGLSRLFPSVPLGIFEEVFVVDGGSTDGTLEYFSDKKIKVLNQTSKGRGEAFKLAFLHTSCDAVVFYGPDGNEDPADLPKFRTCLDQGYDMVIASRMMEGAVNEEDHQVLRFRKWANNLFNLAANLCFNRGPFVTDTINGFRAVTKKCFNLTKADASGFTIEYQLTMRAMKLGLRILEFPTRENPRIGGESGAKAIPTGLAFVRVLIREIVHGRNF